MRDLDEFAKAAMHAILMKGGGDPVLTARSAYDYAGSMVAESVKRQPEEVLRPIGTPDTSNVVPAKSYVPPIGNMSLEDEAGALFNLPSDKIPNLCTRALRALPLVDGASTLGKLAMCSRDRFMGIKNCSEKTMVNMDTCLQDFYLEFGMGYEDVMSALNDFVSDARDAYYRDKVWVPEIPTLKADADKIEYTEVNP